jgi:hypothetical protein
MDKFFKNDTGAIGWKDKLIGITECREQIIFGQVDWPGDLEPATREEFTAAALQSIEKLKAQGIDIGTDWLPKWEPKPGEVVCAWDNHRCEGLIVARFVSRGDGSFPYKLSNHYVYKHIAPFTGEIPEPFKSRWEAESDDPA